MRRPIPKDVLIEALDTEMWERANIPERFWSADWSKIKDKKLLDKMMDAVSRVHRIVRNGSGLFIHGMLGTGKTALAVLFGKEVMRRGGVVTFIPLFDLMRYEIKDVKVSGGEETIMARARRSHLVIIDDLGTETFGVNSKGGAMFEALIRHFYNHKISVIITSNATSNLLAQHYPKALVSLILRTCQPLSVKTTQWLSEAEKILADGLHPKTPVKE